MDLTESLYALLVLSYATLATTSYLFVSLETRARASYDRIMSLKAKDGACNFLWQSVDSEGRPRTPTSSEEELKSSVDRVTSGRNKEIKRWDELQYAMFFLVLFASILLTPVFFIKIDLIKERELVGQVCIVIFAVLQLLTSFAVACIGLNLFRMNSRFEQREKVRGRLEDISIWQNRNGG